MRVVSPRNKIKNSSLKKIGLFFKSQDQQPSDLVLLALFGILIVFGIIMLSSASSVESFKEFRTPYHYVFRQITRGLLPGLVGFLIFSKIDYKKFEKYSPLFLIAAFVLLVSVFVPGVGATFGGATSWIEIGGFTMQPSELVKLLLILFFAGWFSQRGKEKNQDFWNGFVPFILVTGVIAVLIMLQPDLGSLSVIATISACMYFASGAQWKHLALLAGGGAAMFALLIIKAPYRAARLMTFLNPEVDPLGTGYHINQAFLAVGSGGMFGLGFGQSRQKFAYLPEVLGDSIFAVIAEELGFIFSAAFIIILLIIAWRCLSMIRKTNDSFTQYLIVGIISWFIFQAFFNIAAMIGLMPLTGITLPFVSYGGTSLVASLIAAGLLVNISRQLKIS